jgi:hypothetical protein
MQKIAAITTEVPARAPISLAEIRRHESAVTALRYAVLQELSGPDYRPAHTIRRRWPVLHAHIATTARLLHAEGLLERIADPASGGAVPAYRATSAGHAELDRLRTGQAGR